MDSNNSFVDNLHLLILNVGFAENNGDWNWDNICSPFTRIYLVTEGEAQLILDNTTIDLSPKHLYLIPAFATHNCRCNGKFKHYYLHIYEDINNNSGLLEDYNFPHELPTNDIDIEYFRKLCEINPTMYLPQYNPSSYDNNSTLIRNIVRNKQRNLYEKVISRGLVYVILAQFIKCCTSKFNVSDNRIDLCLNFIRRHINEDINIESLASQCCLSKDHFIRLFKNSIGYTPTSYINLKKIEKAQVILATENDSIKDIAYSLSFNDVSYFNRLFKKIVGQTPLIYRHNYTNNEK